MGYGLNAFLKGLVNESLGDYRACHCGAEKVGSLVYSAGLEGRIYVVLDELFLEVLDDALCCAGGNCLLLDALKILCSLTYISDEADNLAVIVFLQPGHN